MPPEHAYLQDITIGSRGARAKLAQEWLSLHGFGVVPDGKFGPASAAAARAFQKKMKLAESGVIDRVTFEALVSPMTKAIQPIKPKAGATLGALTAAYAKQHLAQKPREVGGANAGPWVRLYMDGNEGDQWLWCAGFSTFALRQAAQTLGQPMPIVRSFSCDELARNGTRNNCFCAGPKKGSLTHPVPPGSFFLTRHSENDWQHVGIVIEALPDVMHTIEGNTNDSGSREGYEVCQRVRDYKNKDFILIS